MTGKLTAKINTWNRKTIAVILAVAMVMSLFAGTGIFFATKAELPSSTVTFLADPSQDNIRHYYKVFEERLTWDEAKEKCEQFGGHLATISSQEEQLKIEKALSEGTKNNYWIGGNQEEGAWTWITGEEWGGYTNWAPGMPDNWTGTGNEDKLMLYRVGNPSSKGSQLGHWNDLHATGLCGENPHFGLENMGYICEWDSEADYKEYVNAQPNAYEITIESSIETAGKLEALTEDSFVLDGHRYQLYQSYMKFLETEQYLEDRNCHLATFSSKEENDLVNTYTRKHADFVYIGLTDYKTEGVWEWIDRTPLLFENWVSGEPNNEGNREDWGGIRSDGLWNDGKWDYDVRPSRPIYILVEWNSEADYQEYVNAQPTGLTGDTLAQPDDFNLDVFKANLFFKEGTNPVTNGVSGYYDSINHLHDNNLITPWFSEIESDALTLSLIQSWDDINAVLALDLTKEIETTVKVEDYATAILLKILECDFTTKKLEASRNDNYKDSKKAIASVSKILQISKKADAWENFDWGNIEKYKLSKLNSTESKELEEAIKKSTKISGSIADAIEKIDYVTAGVETIGDLIYKIIDYCSVCEMAEDNFAVLRQMRKHVTYPLLATAIDKVLASENNYIAAVSQAFLDVSVSASLTAYQVYYGKALAELAKACGANVAAVIAAFKIGQASGKLLCDTCFCTSKITEQYYKMKIIDNAENALYSAIDDLGKRYIANMSLANARAYNEAVGLYYNLYDLSADYAKQFSKYVFADGLLGNRGKAKDKYPQFETMISNAQETASRIYNYSNGKWLTWLLVANYPNLFGGVDPINLYQPILLDIIGKLEAGDWDYTEILTDNQNLNCNNVGFSFEDLDGDGVSELLITPISDESADVYDLFTIKNGKVKHLFSGWTRNRYVLQEDLSFINYSSGGGNTGERARYIVADGNLYCLDGVAWDNDKYFSCKQGARDSLRYEWDVSETVEKDVAEKYISEYSIDKIKKKTLSNIHSLNRKIVLESESVQMYERDYTIQNAISLLDGYSDYDLVWTSDNEKVVTASAPGILVANQSGNAKVTISTKDGKSSTILNVVVKPFGSTRTIENEGDSKPNLSPVTTSPFQSGSTLLDGVVKGSNGKWAMYKNGKVDTSYTGIAKNAYGWWRVEKGYVNFNANGIYKNEYGWWKTKDGKVTFDETGVFKNDYGWWRVVNSKVDFSANGIYKNDYGWWKTTNGKVTFKENGVFKNDYGWWKVTNSKVDLKFTGIASNQYGSWYIKNGKVDFSKNGKVQYNGKTYTVKGGKVQ